MPWVLNAQQVVTMTSFAVLGPSPVAWLQAAEARRAAEAEHRYMQLRHQGPAALALQGSAHGDAARQIFEEFYA